MYVRLYVFCVDMCTGAVSRPHIAQVVLNEPAEHSEERQSGTVIVEYGGGGW